VAIAMSAIARRPGSDTVGSRRDEGGSRCLRIDRRTDRPPPVSIAGLVRLTHERFTLARLRRCFELGRRAGLLSSGAGAAMRGFVTSRFVDCLLSGAAGTASGCLASSSGGLGSDHGRRDNRTRLARNRGHGREFDARRDALSIDTDQIRQGVAMMLGGGGPQPGFTR